MVYDIYIDLVHNLYLCISINTKNFYKHIIFYLIHMKKILILYLLVIVYQQK